MDPTVHHKMKADEADDGSGEGLQPRYRQRPDVITGKQGHRNRQLSMLIANIETDVPAE